ncbi:MAG: glycosyltransferase family 2 protein [Planctomycetota bacterium]|nr:glycosyltransferase family 2 protein [Planctomycetota bacterium]MCX8039622.1 glycosyltransferase family 2 protein [Planctomycetota bacterium]MDW8373083.1 glycosyltransferase family 2 protein [Planctomycetota bacterium]
MPDDILISVVIPVKDEEASIPELAAEIGAAFSGQSYAWEAVWVDDGSRDASRARMQELPPPHRWIALDRNHGQSAAFMAGFRAARGLWVGTLDGDGQNDPADLPRQLAYALEHGVDMVNGIRAQRRDAWHRRLLSRLGNGIRNWLTGYTVRDVGCSTRVVRREALLELPFFHGMHRFLPTLVAMKGYRIAEIPVNHRPRRRGRSKYGFWNRAPAAASDLFGVRWLQSRNRNVRVVASGGG